MASPFTVPHFREWAATLVLDNDEPWRPEPWQEAFLRDVFRGFQECWLIVPEGNGKTTLAAGLALYHTLHTPRGYVPVAASSREQAEWAYRQAEGLVKASPALRGQLVCQEGYRRIKCRAQDSRIQIFAADDRTGDGVIPTLCLVDELHRHRDLRLYRTWRGKLGKRPGAQIVTISTAGEPGAEFEETREKIRAEAVKVRRRGCFVRAASAQLVLHEWAVPEDGDVEDFRLVAKANPLKAITAAGLRKKFETPTMTLPHWRRFVCNLPTRDIAAAIMEGEWAAAESPRALPQGEPVWLGLDVAWKWDTTAMVPFWMPERAFRLLGPARILSPPRDGTSLDPLLVERALVEIHQRNPIHTVVMDMTKAEQLAAWIAAELGARVVDRGTANKDAVQDYDRFMEALRSGWLYHSGDAGLRRHVMNAVARLLPGGDARFDRHTSSRAAGARNVHGEQERRVIDALTAAAMVHTVASANEPQVEPMVAWA